MTTPPQRDSVLDRLHDLEDSLRAALRGRAVVEHRALDGSSYEEVRVTPRDSASIPVTWPEAVSAELILSAGPGGRWELAWSDAAVDFVEEVVTAAVEGRIRTVTAPGCAAAYVSKTDGTTVRSSVCDGCHSGLVILPG